jgi:hypothetical protein
MTCKNVSKAKGTGTKWQSASKPAGMTDRTINGASRITTHRLRVMHPS